MVPTEPDAPPLAVPAPVFKGSSPSPGVSFTMFDPNSESSAATNFALVPIPLTVTVLELLSSEKDFANEPEIVPDMLLERVSVSVMSDLI